MYRLWWQLPGPAQFVSVLTQELRDAKCVLIYLPEHAPRDIASAVRSALGAARGGDWYTIRARDERPIDLLFSNFEIRDDAIRSARALANSGEFTEKLIWLEGVTPRTWDGWKDFFADYGEACQRVPEERRTLFCVPLAGELNSRPSLLNPQWSRYRWHGVVSSLDMLLFTSSMIQEKSLTSLQKRVATSVIARLALWDPEVCERLAMSEMKDILNPSRVLREVAAERGWGMNACEPSWENGMSYFVDGKWKTHSSALASRGSYKEVNRRIWSAEISVLLPLVEEARQKLIADLRDRLKIPWRVQHTKSLHTVVNDPFDLEINHISSQIKQGKVSIEIETQQLVEQLQKIRNLLSHLKNIPVELLNSEVLNQFFETQFDAELLSRAQGNGDEDPGAF